MIPLDRAAASEVEDRLGLPASPGLLALRHALEFGKPGLWGDAPSSPRSVILIRQGDGRLEAFGAGDPEPALGWLVGRRRGFALVAPETWLAPLRARVGEVGRDEVETWSVKSAPSSPPPPTTPRVVTRRLTPDDFDGFVTSAPSWGLRGWGSYAAMIEHGAAFGVPDGARGFASLAWVFDQAGPYDALGVFTASRYRRLGLARAAASALSTYIVGPRGHNPLWSVRTDNPASLALARSLGFSPAATERLMCWPVQGEETGDRRQETGGD